MSKENCPNCGDKNPYRNSSRPEVAKVPEEKLFEKSDLYRAMQENLEKFRNDKNKRVKDTIGILLIALFPAMSSLLLGAFWNILSTSLATSMVFSAVVLTFAFIMATGTLLKWNMNG